MSKTTTLAQMRALAQRASGAAAKVAQAAADAIEELARIKADRPGAADVTIPGEGWKEDGSGPLPREVHFNQFIHFFSFSSRTD